MYLAGENSVGDVVRPADRCLPSDDRITIRAATMSDEPFLRAVVFEVKAEDLAPLGLPAPMLEVMLEQQMRARQQGYAAMFPGAKHFIVDRLGTPVGYLMLVTLEGDRLHLIDIALTAGARGQGIGTAVLTELIAAAREEQVRWLTLSVNVTNHGAVRLYTRLGFQACDQGNEPMASREMRLDLSSIIAPTCDPDQAAKAAHQQSTPPVA